MSISEISLLFYGLSTIGLSFTFQVSISNPELTPVPVHAHLWYLPAINRNYSFSFFTNHGPSSFFNRSQSISIFCFRCFVVVDRRNNQLFFPRVTLALSLVESEMKTVWFKQSFSRLTKIQKCLRYCLDRGVKFLTAKNPFS